MYEFDYKDTFVIEGRGRMYAFDGDQIPEEMWDPVQLTGQTVIIKGIGERKVRGVETFCITRSPEGPYRDKFGLLVADPLDNDDDLV